MNGEQDSILEAERGRANRGAARGIRVKAGGTFSKLAKQIRRGILEGYYSKDLLCKYLITVIGPLTIKDVEKLNYAYYWHFRTTLRAEIQRLVREERIEPGIERQLTNLWPVPSVYGGLDKKMRTDAINAARRLPKKNWPTAFVDPVILSRWIFDDKVWNELVKRAKGSRAIRYGQYTIAGRQMVYLFEPPSDRLIARWTEGGAIEFLRATATRLDKQLYAFSVDISYMISRRVAAASPEMLAGARERILGYQGNWESLGSSTGTLSIIQRQLIPIKKYSFVKYLWSEKERRKLRIWQVLIGKLKETY